MKNTKDNIDLIGHKVVNTFLDLCDFADKEGLDRYETMITFHSMWEALLDQVNPYTYKLKDTFLN